MDKIFFDKLVKIDMRTYDNIPKIAVGKGCDYRTGFLLDYQYFKKHHKLTAIDKIKQQALGADTKAV